jgi:hypothetical protein
MKECDQDLGFRGADLHLHELLGILEGVRAREQDKTWTRLWPLPCLPLQRDRLFRGELYLYLYLSLHCWRTPTGDWLYQKSWLRVPAIFTEWIMGEGQLSYWK